MKQAETSLVNYFGADRAAKAIAEADADEWRASLRTDGYSTATISRTILYARQFFKWAIRRGIVPCKP